MAAKKTLNAYQVTYTTKQGKGRNRYDRSHYAYVIASSLSEAADKLAAEGLKITNISTMDNYKVII